MEKILLFLSLVLPSFADAPSEWIFLRPDADSTWQNAIGVYIQSNSSLTVYDAPNDSGKVILESYNPSDTNICPMSAFGYYDESMKKAYKRYPLIAIKDKYVKVVYNVNTGASGWVKTKDKGSIKLLADTMAFCSMDVIYLAAVGAKNYHAIPYYDKPNGKLSRWNTIMPLVPQKFTQELPEEDERKDWISVRGYGWCRYSYDLRLGTVVKIIGDWAQLGTYMYEEGYIKHGEWIRIRDKNGKLLVWFVDVDRC